MTQRGGSRWSVETLKKGLLCPRRCMRQVAGGTAEQVFIKAAEVWDPRFFLPLFLPFFHEVKLPTPLRAEGNISRAPVFLSFFPFRVFLIGSRVRVIRCNGQKVSRITRGPFFI